MKILRRAAYITLQFCLVFTLSNCATSPSIPLPQTRKLSNFYFHHFDSNSERCQQVAQQFEDLMAKEWSKVLDADEEGHKPIRKCLNERLEPTQHITSEVRRICDPTNKIMTAWNKLMGYHENILCEECKPNKLGQEYCNER